jgi:pimeloyl-ACP methyl ester carboxylesterase
MVTTREVRLADGRVLRAHDGGGEPGAFAILWHHGSPQTGAPLQPMLQAAAARGLRVISYGRPSYGGSSPLPGRSVAAAARDAEQVADAFAVGRFAAMGASGGGPHALACAALLPDRVGGVACLAGIAPPDGAGLDWFAGMADAGALRAALAGRDARARYEETATFDPAIFTDADSSALAGAWSALEADVGEAAAFGPDGLIDDDVAFATPWGFDLAAVAAPTLIVQGGQDRIVPPAHGAWLARTLPNAELWFRPGDGHISVLDACPPAMDWLLAHA